MRGLLMLGVAIGLLVIAALPAFAGVVYDGALGWLLALVPFVGAVGTGLWLSRREPTGRRVAWGVAGLPIGFLGLMVPIALLAALADPFSGGGYCC